MEDSSRSHPEMTDFGFEQVPWQDKQRRVSAVFDSVSQQYDRMNDLMSLGLHRYWKRYAVMLSGARAGEQVLDLAGGTGDLTRLLARAVGLSGSVNLADINLNMLSFGRDRLINEGIKGVFYSLQNAEHLAFKPYTFDLVCMAFGLRNVTDKLSALRSMYTVLKPGGRLMILEFSKPTMACLNYAYEHYLFNILPWLGDKVAGDSDSYRYLAESIRKHPDQQALAELIRQAGFEDGAIENLLGGIVAIHKAYKY